MSKLKLLLFMLAMIVCRADDEEAGDPNEGEGEYGTVIGIDLGTTYSCVGIYQNGKVEIIANEQGNRITPSYVAFTSTERLIGDSAKNQVASNPKNTVYDAKRLIGRKYSDRTVKADMKLWPFTVVQKDSKPYIEVDFKGKKTHFCSRGNQCYGVNQDEIDCRGLFG